MPIPSRDTTPIQNIGFVDRVFRFVIGAGLVAVMVFYYEMERGPVLNTYVQVLLVIFALYPLWTCTVGWDPVYAVFGIRSGNDKGRNQVGTFPYQVKAAFGTAPKYSDVKEERSLEACHYAPEEQPLHPNWRVNREPILYPDREALNEYFRTHPGPSAQTASGRGHDQGQRPRQGANRG